MSIPTLLPAVLISFVRLYPYLHLFGILEHRYIDTLYSALGIASKMSFTGIFKQIIHAKLIFFITVLQSLYLFVVQIVKSRTNLGVVLDSNSSFGQHLLQSCR